MNLSKRFFIILLVISCVFTVSCSSNKSGSNDNAASDDSETNSNASSIDLSQTENSDTDGKYAQKGMLKLRIFKMGKSDAYLFRTSEKTILIDCGDVDDSQEILDYFAEKGLTKIDYLIFTHLDKKSIGGAANIIKSLEIGTVYEPNYLKNNTEYSDYSKAMSDKKISSTKIDSIVTFDNDGVSFKISPCEKKSYSDDDNYSCTISVVHGDNSFLFVGDAKSERISEIIKNDVKHDFLMIPDNGTWNEKTEALLDAVSPSYVAITCSEKNPASTNVLELLSKKGINSYQTINGSIKITSDSKQIVIEQ